MTAVDSRRHLVDTRLGQMHVRTAGEGGTPLLLVHSQIVAGQLYDHVVPMLAQDRLVIVPDRIGHGLSDPQTGYVSIAQYAEATVDALDALGIEQCDAVGIHTGSREVVELATEHASRIRRAVLCTITVYPDEAARNRIKEMYANPGPGPAEDGSHLDFYWKWWTGITPEGVDIEQTHRWFVDHLLAPTYHLTFAASVDYPTGDKLPRIEQPLLVLMPHDDSYPGMQPALPLLPPQAELIDLPHITNVMSVFTTDREEIVAPIRRFLA
jgi:pimeloyl-ACP methyl ester carboxylesterase